jgi:hypothetical protein
MAHTFTENVGIIQELIAYMQNTDNQAALTAKDFDVTPHLARLQTKLGSINQINTQQEQAKVAMRKQTEALNTAMDDGYTDASGVLDAMMGLLGKTTTEAKNLQTIRSKVRRGSNGSPTPATTPAHS